MVFNTQQERKIAKVIHEAILSKETIDPSWTAIDIFGHAEKNERIHPLGTERHFCCYLLESPQEGRMVLVFRFLIQGTTKQTFASDVIMQRYIPYFEDMFGADGLFVKERLKRYDTQDSLPPQLEKTSSEKLFKSLCAKNMHLAFLAHCFSFNENVVNLATKISKLKGRERSVLGECIRKAQEAASRRRATPGDKIQREEDEWLRRLESPDLNSPATINIIWHDYKNLYNQLTIAVNDR